MVLLSATAPLFRPAFAAPRSPRRICTAAVYAILQNLGAGEGMRGGEVCPKPREHDNFGQTEFVIRRRLKERSPKLSPGEIRAAEWERGIDSRPGAQGAARPAGRRPQGRRGRGAALWFAGRCREGSCGAGDVQKRPCGDSVDQPLLLRLAL